MKNIQYEQDITNAIYKGKNYTAVANIKPYTPTKINSFQILIAYGPTNLKKKLKNTRK